MNPFDQVDFTSGQTSSISNDDIVRVLSKLTPSMSQGLGQDANTTGGVERVNAGTREHGSVAYRDDKGQVVLTNMARDASGAEKPIAALFRPPAQQQATESAGPTFVAGAGEMRLNIYEGLKQLTAAKDAQSARAIYNNMQESIVAEATRLQTEAQKFAENKFGIPTLLQQLQAARQADMADPMYAPGMGDSPITQQIVDDLAQLSAQARLESDTFLKRNVTFNSLTTLGKNAEMELKRVEGLEAAAERRKEVAGNAKIVRDENRIMRKEERQEREEEEQLRAYNSLTGDQLERLHMLHGADLIGIENENERKIKLISIAKGNKDKKYQDAISAEGPRQLLSFALQGNGHARKLLILDEAKKTGSSVEAVEERLRSLSTQLTSGNFNRIAAEVMARDRTMTKESRAEINTNLQLNKLGLNDPAKVQKADETKIAILLANEKFKIDQRFLSDVESWNLSDPAMKLAIDKAKKTAGRADISNVLTAYMSETTDRAERRMRLEEFRKALRNAALKQQGSVFGGPNWREAEKTVVNHTVVSGWLTKAYNAVNDEAASQYTDDILKITNGQFMHPAANMAQNLSGAFLDFAFGRAPENK